MEKEICAKFNQIKQKRSNFFLGYFEGYQDKLHDENDSNLLF